MQGCKERGSLPMSSRSSSPACWRLSSCQSVPGRGSRSSSRRRGELLAELLDRHPPPPYPFRSSCGVASDLAFNMLCKTWLSPSRCGSSPPRQFGADSSLTDAADPGRRVPEHNEVVKNKRLQKQSPGRILRAQPSGETKAPGGSVPLHQRGKPETLRRPREPARFMRRASRSPMNDLATSTARLASGA